MRWWSCLFLLFFPDIPLDWVEELDEDWEDESVDCSSATSIEIGRSTNKPQPEPRNEPTNIAQNDNGNV